MLCRDAVPGVSLREVLQHRNKNVDIVQILDRASNRIHEARSVFLDILIPEQLVVR